MTDLVREDLEGGIVGGAQERFLNLVTEKAKPIVGRSIDYTMLVGLLLLQFLSCRSATAQDLQNIIFNNATEGNITEDTAKQLYTCDVDEKTFVFSSHRNLNICLLVALGVGLTFGITSAIFVWVHANRTQAKNAKLHAFTEELYKCTDKFILLDSILEIPISFFWAPIMTSILWVTYFFTALGLFFLARLQNSRSGFDENAKAVFNTSAILVALSLYKLIGEISQYWVLYTAATSETADQKFEKLKQDEQVKAEKKAQDEQVKAEKKAKKAESARSL
jgi:hypothetical protein